MFDSQDKNFPEVKDELPVNEGIIIADGELAPVIDREDEPQVHVKALMPFQDEFELVFLNAAQVYMRIPFWLPQRFREEFNKPLDIIHLVLPGPMLDEGVIPPHSIKPPEPGWSRFIQAIPKRHWPNFRDWLVSSTWLWRDAKQRKSQYNLICEVETLMDPAKLYQKEVISIQDRVDINFVLPASGSGRIYLDTKHGVPLKPIYLARVKVKDHEDPFGVNITRLAKKIVEDQR